MAHNRFKTVSFSPSNGELISLGRWTASLQAKGYTIIRIKGEKQYSFTFNLNDEPISDAELLAFGQHLYDHLSSGSEIYYVLGDEDVRFLELEKEALLNRFFRWLRSKLK